MNENQCYAAIEDTTNTLIKLLITLQVASQNALKTMVFLRSFDIELAQEEHINVQKELGEAMQLYNSIKMPTQLLKNRNDGSNDITEEEVKEALEELIKQGRVRKEKGGYRLIETSHTKKGKQ